MSPQSLTISTELHRYILERGLREPSALAALRAETDEHPQRQMQLAPEQGQLLALLVQLQGARRTLDIGTFTGYSALSVALALPEDGRVISCDVNAKDTAIAQHFWNNAGAAHKIELRLAPALETLAALLAEGHGASFDFAFIDADKANYIEYFKQSLELLKVGGLIAVDNTLWSGRVVETEPELNSTRNIQAFNDHVHSESDVDMVLLPIGDGLTLARKK